MNPERILVTRIRRIGDVILSLPLLDALHETFPNAAIDYLAEQEPAQAVLGHPAVRRIHTLDRSVSIGLPAAPALLGALRAARYDWVIDLYGNPRTALLTAWTGASVRVGPDRRLRRKLYTHRMPLVPEPLSAVEHHLLALRLLGIQAPARPPRIHLAPAELDQGRAAVRAAVPGSGPVVGLHVGNRWPAKRWPEDRFGDLLERLSSIGAQGIVLAGPGEEDLARRVAGAARIGAPVLAGLPLRRYWAVLASLDVLVTNDGSPIHAGPAVGTPTIGILGPTQGEIWFPYDRADGHDLLHRPIWCRPCHRHVCPRLDCLRRIDVEDALSAVARALERTEAAAYAAR